MSLNQTEKRVLDDMLRYLPAEWEIFSSVWLRRHPIKKHAEADFVVISTKGVLIIEVKGSQVKRNKNGGWEFGSNQKGWYADESPFEQAKSTYHSFEEHFRHYNLKQLFYDRIWGWGVVLPNCALTIEGVDPLIEEELYLDIKRYPDKLHEWIESLFDYWREDNIRLKQNRNIPMAALRPNLSADDRQQIIKMVQPLIRSDDGVFCIRGAQQETIRLTEEQKKALNYHETDQIIFQGPPGTGKTILCREIAYRESLKGKKVLYVCYNRLLAQHIQREFKNKSDITVLNYHQLIFKLGRDADENISGIDDWKIFNEKVEGLVLSLTDKLQRKGTPFEKYDYLVMDEFQDLMTSPFISSLELLFNGGWKSGNWAIAGDPDQAIFQDQYDPSEYERLKDTAGASFCRLKVNCRNTRDIAIYSHGLSGIGKPKIRKRENQPVSSVMLLYYESPESFAEEIKRQVNDLLLKLNKLASESRTIAILAADHGFLPPELNSSGFFNAPVSNMEDSAPWQIKIGTLQSFKGLEASAVILLGLENLDKSLDKELMYIGGTRAMLFLRIIVHEQNKTTLIEKQSDILKFRQLLT